MLRAPNGQLLAASALVALGFACLIFAGVIGFSALDGGGDKQTATILPVVVKRTSPPTTQPPRRTYAPIPTNTPEPTAVPFAGPITIALFDEKLAACGAYPNGSAHQARQTTRFSFSLPQDLFPDIAGFEFVTASGTATAGYISNGGPFGHAFEAKPGCCKYYFEFIGSGETVLTARSPVEGAPEYAVHFVVEGLQ